VKFAQWPVDVEEGCCSHYMRQGLICFTDTHWRTQHPLHRETAATNASVIYLILQNVRLQNLSSSNRKRYQASLKGLVGKV